MTGEYLLGSD